MGSGKRLSKSTRSRGVKKNIIGDVLQKDAITTLRFSHSSVCSLPIGGRRRPSPVHTFGG